MTERCKNMEFLGDTSGGTALYWCPQCGAMEKDYFLSVERYFPNVPDSGHPCEADGVR
jgi:hypothetical protein